MHHVIRLFESLWHNAFNLVYPTIDVLNQRYELTTTIDIPLQSGAGKIHVVHLENSNAEELAQTLQALIGGTGAPGSTARPPGSTTVYERTAIHRSARQPAPTAPDRAHRRVEGTSTVTRGRTLAHTPCVMRRKGRMNSRTSRNGESVSPIT